MQVKFNRQIRTEPLTDPASGTSIGVCQFHHLFRIQFKATFRAHLDAVVAALAPGLGDLQFDFRFFLQVEKRSLGIHEGFMGL
ncbi:uncharacterized protein METZ01_LOCUS427781, partial [marine metagenome]